MRPKIAQDDLRSRLDSQQFAQLKHRDRHARGLAAKNGLEERCVWRFCQVCARDSSQVESAGQGADGRQVKRPAGDSGAGHGGALDAKE